MSLDIFRERGVPLEQQSFDWVQLAGMPISKLDSDAFTRVRIILMNGIESEAVRFQHACARLCDPGTDLLVALARVRRQEHHQQTMVNWLLPADLSPLETTIGYEQVAIEVTASVAEHEPDQTLAQVYRFGMLEDFDHLYRFSALMDRVYGMDANAILQCYTDIIPGRPTMVEHRAPEDDLRLPYDRTRAAPLTKLHALTIVAAENQVHDYYLNIGPTFADPLARQLYAEIASIEEQHVSQYESLMDPKEAWLEKWLLHEATEVYNYYSCLLQESDSRVKSVWQRGVDYELGHLHFVRGLFEEATGRGADEVLPATLPDPIEFRSHRAFVRGVLAREVDLRARGHRIIPRDQEGPDSPSVRYRQRINASGSPSQAVAKSYLWQPGTELSERIHL